MAQPRDVFTIAAFGRAPTLADCLVLLPDAVCERMVGAACASLKAAKAQLMQYDAEEHASLMVQAQLILQAARLDADELGSLVRSFGIDPGGETRHALALSLIERVGVEKATPAIAAALAPGALNNRGTFSHFVAPCLPTNLDILKMSDQLEAALEATLSDRQQKKRLVKVRAELVGSRLIVAVYYQRRDTDGSEISAKKRLSTKQFARPAASTYFAITQFEKQSRVMLRSPDSKLVQQMRPLIALAIWGKDFVISDKAHNEYKLALVKNPNFQFSVPPEVADRIDRVRLTDIEMNAATGNLVTVKAVGAAGDALTDFRAMAENARVLIQNSAVRSISFKLHMVKDKRIRPSIRVTPTSLTLDDQYIEVVHDLLEHWQIAPTSALHAVPVVATNEQEALAVANESEQEDGDVNTTFVEHGDDSEQLAVTQAVN